MLALYAGDMLIADGFTLAPDRLLSTWFTRLYPI